MCLQFVDGGAAFDAVFDAYTVRLLYGVVKCLYLEYYLFLRSYCDFFQVFVVVLFARFLYGSQEPPT